ncbi:MAG TPA: rhodanese-like domain-containing protein [Dehalococcoidia bacterium]|nr:rhodanese-like domain-containing protein [Dehalococcoidia bacterium]
MKAIQFVHEGLGNSSYVLDLGNDKAVLIDPDRNVKRYLDALASNGLKAVGIFETHLHADFVSGANELASQTGATIFVPSEAESKLPHQGLRGGQSLRLDGCEVTAVASAGHTPEHLSYVYRTPSGPPLLFSGGSLIVGGAARTDLISAAMTEPLTRAQFRTLHGAFSHLPDETLLYPTHGGGSFCSTGAGQDRTSTLGRERRDNPLLAFSDEDEFVAWFPTTFPAVPDYFARMRGVNQAGPRLRREIADPPALGPDEFARLRTSSVVVDGRSKEAYAKGHIPGSLSNPFRDDFPVWLGWLVPEDANLLFVTDGTSVNAMVEQSLLVGYERLVGWLEGGTGAWKASGRELRRIELVDAQRARKYLGDGAASLDIREPSEFEAGHIEGAIHIPLGKLAGEAGNVPHNRPVLVYCGHGERASTAISLLEAAGWSDLVNLDGGIGAWESAGYSLARGA